MAKAGDEVYIMQPGWIQPPSMMHDPDGTIIRRVSPITGFVAQWDILTKDGWRQFIDEDLLFVKTSNFAEMFSYQRLVMRLREAIADADPELGPSLSSRASLEEYITSLHPQIAELLHKQNDY